MKEEKDEKTAAASPFDPSRLRLSQNFGASLGVKKVMTAVPVRRPDRQAFVRCHPDAAYRLSTALLEVKEDRESFLVEPSLWSELAGEIVPKVLVTSVTRQGVLFLWPIRLPGEDGKLDDWNRSAFDAADLAAKQWVRVSANMNLGAYEIFEATGTLPEPQWPALGFQEILRLGFKDRFIDSLDHPVLRKLRGQS